MQRSIKTLLSFFCILVFTVSYQNCSPNHYVAEGNGSPHEGLSHGGSNGGNSDDTGTDLDSGDSVGNTNNNTSLEIIEYTCIPTSTSELFRLVEFGTNAAGKTSAHVYLTNNTVIAVPWDPQESYLQVNRFISNREIFEHMIFSQGSLALTYSKDKLNIITDIFNCSSAVRD